MLFFLGVSNCLIFLFISSVYLSLSFPISATEGNRSSDYIFCIFTHITCPIGSEFFLVPSLQKASCVGPGPSRRDTRVRLNVRDLGVGHSAIPRETRKELVKAARTPTGISSSREGWTEAPRRPCTPRKFPQTFSNQSWLRGVWVPQQPACPASLMSCVLAVGGGPVGGVASTQTEGWFQSPAAAALG